MSTGYVFEVLRKKAVFIVCPFFALSLSSGNGSRRGQDTRPFVVLRRGHLSESPLPSPKKLTHARARTR
ncbi:hypothetical protein TNCV_1510611 [Trichonephila clavipes]|nr:hypothetical protein TNCV_1510611 [Trichonephila clavipes]